MPMNIAFEKYTRATDGQDHVEAVRFQWRR